MPCSEAVLPRWQDIIDFQVHDYGLRNDTAMWPFHQEALQWLPWEWALGDMAYEMCNNILTQFVSRRMLTAREMLYNMVLGHYRSRVEAVVADLVRHKGLFTHPWAGSIAVLQALMKFEAHATQLYRNMFAGTRYIECAGPYVHAPFL